MSPLPVRPLNRLKNQILIPFTFSIHGKNNFPYRKEKSNLDIVLPDGNDDQVYLDSLQKGIQESLKEANPEIVIYLAGADPYRHDRFGRLDLSKEGLADRDRMVLRYCHEAGLPAAFTHSPKAIEFLAFIPESQKNIQ